MNGRSGQEQHGVDVYGIPEGKTRYFGIQCKSKDRLVGAELTEKEVRKEVENAKGFQPPLEEFLIVTSGSSDARLLALARQITQEHAAQNLFRVEIVAWPDVRALLPSYPEVIAEFYPHLMSPGTDQSARADAQHAQLVSGQLDIKQQLSRQLEQLAALASRLTAPADPAAAREDPLSPLIDSARQLLDAHEFRAALRILERLREERWASASVHARFRIATNQGAAHMGLGNYPRAARFFLEAFEFDPITDKALSNRALALLLLDRNQEALIAAREVMDKHPRSAAAWIAWLNVLSRVQPDEPLPEVPEEFAQDPQLLFVRADGLAYRREWDAAEQTFRQYFALPNPDVQAKSRLAEVLITQVTGGRFLFGASYSASQIARLKEAQKLLVEGWEAVKRTDLAAQSLHVVLNLCGLCAGLGEFTRIETPLDEALSIAPDDPRLNVWKIRLAVTRKDGATALRLLAKVSPQTVEDYAILAAGAHRANGQTARAVEILEQHVRESADPAQSVDARCLFADMVCESDPHHAEARFNALPYANTPPVARATVIFARALHQHNPTSAAETYLTQARESLATSADLHDRVILADVLVEFGDHEAAVAIYEKDVSTTTDTPSLREYLRSLIVLNRRRRATYVLASLPPELSQQLPYESLRANLAIVSGDFRAARLALERCFTVEPDNVILRLLWADVSLRLEDPDPARQWLSAVNPRSRALTLDELRRLGRLLKALGKHAEAAAALYEALRRFPHDPKAHTAFCSSVLFKGSPAWRPKAPSVADTDSAVRLRDPDGVEKVYILEDRPEEELLLGEIAIHSDLGKRLLGRKPGDTVVGHASAYAVHESTVVSVEHKFVHALQASMGAFNTRFPEQSGMVSVKMPLSGPAEERLAPIRRMLKDKVTRRNEIEAQYRLGFPIAHVAVLMGLTSIDAWRTLIGRPEQPIVVCAGNPQEREAALRIIDSKQHRFILEPIALFQLHVLDALKAAEATLGRLAIVQTTRDELRAQLAELDLHADGYMTTFMEGDQLCRRDVSAQEVAHERRRLQSLLDWTREHCDIVPGVPLVDLSPDLAPKLDKVLGSAAHDTLLAAQGGQFVLVSDDLHLRILARAAGSTEGIWLQPLLMRAAEAKHLEPGHYNRAVMSLAGWRHNFTSVGAFQLFFAAARGNWKVTPAFEAVVSTLRLSNSEIQSNLSVCVWFLRQLWQKGAGPTKPQAAKLTRALLKGVDPLTAPHGADYFRQLAGAVQSGQLPERAWRAIREWALAQQQNQGAAK